MLRTSSDDLTFGGDRRSEIYNCNFFSWPDRTTRHMNLPSYCCNFPVGSAKSRSISSSIPITNSFESIARQIQDHPAQSCISSHQTERLACRKYTQSG